MMVRHVTQLLWKMCFGDYILPEFCHCLIFFVQKNWCWFILTNTKYYRAFFIIRLFLLFLSIKQKIFYYEEYFAILFVYNYN